MSKKIKSLEEWCREKNITDLLDEWNDKLMPSKIEYNSPRISPWVCREGHKWESRVAARTIFSLKCPVCNPEMTSLPIGAKHGCLEVIGRLGNYHDEIASKFNMPSEHMKRYINVCYGTEMLYKCKCKCGNTGYIDEFSFLQKKRRYCEDMLDAKACGRRKVREVEYDKSYHFDYLNTKHASLDIYEYVGDEKASFHRRGEEKIYKTYNCRCYLCGEERGLMYSSEFSIYRPDGGDYRGYLSGAYCPCHEPSSFEWCVMMIFFENKVPYRVEESFPGLYGTKHGKLRYDFAVLNPDNTIKCLIECHGEQHKKPSKKYGGETQFEIQKKHDELKRVYAKEHGIHLYEIEYEDRDYDKIKDILKSNGVI